MDATRRRHGGRRGPQDFATPAPQVPLAQGRRGDADDVALRREAATTHSDAIVSDDSGDPRRPRWRAGGACDRPRRRGAGAEGDVDAGSAERAGCVGRRGHHATVRRYGAQAAEDPPPMVDAAAPQPPMPAWPGEARRPGVEPAPSEDDPDGSADNVVHLTRPRRP